jgi:O-antigen ligase
MNPSLATCLFLAGIAGLFYLDRNDSARPSKFLWLPILWLATAGSRPVSVWLGIAPVDVPGQLPASSGLDQLFAATLMGLGIIVLFRRPRDVRSLLKANWPLVLYFSFALISLAWSDFPAWGFKRWVRAWGDVIMVLIVATEAQPAAALRHLFSGVGFVLLPASVLLIKYYPDLGQNFDEYGLRSFTGVTSNKNMLGVLVFVLALGALWQILCLLRANGQPNRTRRLVAQCTLLAVGIYLLRTANSATSVASFALGAGLMLIIARPVFRARPAAVHGLTLILLLAASLTVLLGGKDEVAEALGRNPTLTGRTEIWSDLIQMARDPIGGTGFETFWLAPRVEEFYRIYGGISRTIEAHNGYIEVYLNLGVIGVGLVALIIVHGYYKTVTAFRGDSGVAALLVAYVVALAAYNIGEAGFRMMSLSWFFLLLSVVTASRVAHTRAAGSANNSRSRTW